MSCRPQASARLTTATGDPARLEQHGLGLEVLLHGPVVVEVLGRKVREDPGGELDRVCPVLVEGV